MPPIVAVVQLTDSFAQIWDPLVQRAGGSVRLEERLAVTSRNSAAVLIAAGGAEHSAAAVIEPIAASASAPPMAVVGALHDHRVAIDAIRAGAKEYFALPEDMHALESWLGEQLHPETQSTQARGTHDYSRIIGRSRSLLQALELTSKVTPHADANVLLTGETGTGKELIAHAIHYNGPRASGPFVDVNCASLPAHLVEAELFGFEPGAFTDARSAKPGLFETADGGTLFLDEVGELPLEIQAKLLRALDLRRVRRLGATQSKAVDARIIAATHVDLAAAVRNGNFREDLFYRLNVFTIHLPPLRERGDDVILLAEHFLRQFAERTGVKRLLLDEGTRKMLRQHTWPGNVRELRNAIERAMLLGDGKHALTPARSEATSLAGTLPFPADMETIQQAAARGMLERHRGNKSAAALALGISRKRLYALLHGELELKAAASRRQVPVSSFVQENRPRPLVPLGWSRLLWNVERARLDAEKLSVDEHPL